MRNIYLLLLFVLMIGTSSCEKEVLLDETSIINSGCILLYSTNNGAPIVGEWYDDRNNDYYSECFGNVKILGHVFDGVNGMFITETPIKRIGGDAFTSSVTSVTIPNSVTSIGGSAFSGCTSLTSLTIPDGVTSIVNNAFEGCSRLTSITIPDSVTSIGEYAFEDCRSLTSVTIPDSVTSIGNSAFDECTSLTSVTIGNSVTSIGNWAFYNCTSLTSVTIPDSVTSIGRSAFNDCTSLTSVTIPDSVTSIGDYAFNGCTSLKDTYVNITDLASYSTSNPMHNIGGNKHLLVNGTEITELLIPDSVTSIGSDSFYNCTSLTSITIPNSVTSIGGRAFYYCTSLTSVTIPNSVTKIGYYAFEGCTSLTSVYCKPTTPPTGGKAMFDSNASGRKIYVPRNSVSDYKAAAYWKEYASYIIGYNF